MKADTNHIQRVFLIILLALITLSFFHSPGTGDVKYWLQWMKTFDAQGPFRGFESTQWDYPPLSSIILFWTAKMAHLFSIDFFSGLKLSLALFLGLTSIVFWIWTKDLLLTVILHCSLIVNSILLVYIDVFFAPCLILSLWAIKERNIALFTIFYSLSCLIKWQPIIVAPFVLLYILNIKKISEWKDIDFRLLVFRAILPLLIIVSVTLALFSMSFLKSFVSAMSEVHLSGNALNFSWIMTYILHVFYPEVFGHLVMGEAEYIITGSLKIMLIPKSLFVVFYTITFMAFLKQEKSFENLVYYSLIGYMAYFIFNTGAHENHLFLVAILAVVLIFLNRVYIMTSVFIILMSNINLIIFYGLDGKGLMFSRVAGVDVTFLFSILNVGFFLMIWYASCLKRLRTCPSSLMPG